MNYSHNFGSNFPNSLIPVGSKKDIDDSVKDLILQYESYIASGNLSSANNLYNTNKTKLDPYIINMNYVNRLEEEIFNMGVYSLRNTYSQFGTKEPIDQSTDGFWYTDY